MNPGPIATLMREILYQESWALLGQILDHGQISYDNFRTYNSGALVYSYCKFTDLLGFLNLYDLKIKENSIMVTPSLTPKEMLFYEKDIKTSNM
jgi:hypothetical protein